MASQTLACQKAEIITNDNNLVTLTTEDLEITCVPQKSHTFKNHEKVTIDFALAKDRNGNNDPTKPYQFEINNKPAKILSLRFLHKPEGTWVAHGPGDVPPFPPCTNCLRIFGDVGNKALFIEAHVVNPEDVMVIASCKRSDHILIEFREDDPYHFYVIGMKMKIAIFELYDKEDTGN